MTTLHETAYPSLKPDPTPRELAELYTPTKDEQLLAAGIGKRALPRMAALIHLKVFQRLGYSGDTFFAQDQAIHLGIG